MANNKQDNIELNNAAILMMSLSPEQASKIMKYLEPKEVQKLGLAMAEVNNIDNSKKNSVLRDFLSTANKHTSIGINSNQKVRKILASALGDSKAKSVIDQIFVGSTSKGLEALKWMDKDAIFQLIKNEHPQIQAVVISYLDPSSAAQVLESFEPNQRFDIIMRISNQDKIAPKAIEVLNNIIENNFKIKSLEPSKPISLGGVKMVADILNNFDKSVESELIEAIKEKNEDLATEITDLMFIFENLLDLDSRSMQAVLRESNSDTLVIALKAASDEIKNHVFSNMSKRAAELLKDDLETKGPVKLSEVEKAQKEILDIAKKLAEAGEITMGAKGEEMV